MGCLCHPPMKVQPQMYAYACLASLVCASADTAGPTRQLGAFVNETFQAREGLPPDLFPGGVPTYLGHYHKPHVVGATRVQYVGSPYEGAGWRVAPFAGVAAGRPALVPKVRF